MVVAARGRTVSFCLARNEQTEGSPFISALEVVNLEESMYNGTDFGKYALSTVARRHRFGKDGDIISYPEDSYNRYWQPFTDSNPSVECHSNITSSEFWNLPPEAVLQQALTTSRGKQLVVQWPPVALPAAVYYIALYFQDNRTPSPYSWRVFDVAMNVHDFFRGLNVSIDGAMVFGAQWSLWGKLEIVLTPSQDSPVRPVINAGEVLQVVPFGDRTLTRDVIAMEELARSLKNPLPEWTGDPCLPKDHSWTGVLCSQDGSNIVVALNLTNFGLSGTLPNSIDNLTALANIWLSESKLYGPVPKLNSLKNLVSLHLQHNEFSGPIPSSLGELPNIKEIYLQNNQLTGPRPDNLKKKTGVDISNEARIRKYIKFFCVETKNGVERNLLRFLSIYHSDANYVYTYLILLKCSQLLTHQFALINYVQFGQYIHGMEHTAHLHTTPSSLTVAFGHRRKSSVLL